MEICWQWTLRAGAGAARANRRHVLGREVCEAPPEREQPSGHGAEERGARGDHPAESAARQHHGLTRRLREPGRDRPSRGAVSSTFLLPICKQYTVYNHLRVWRNRKIINRGVVCWSSTHLKRITFLLGRQQFSAASTVINYSLSLHFTSRKRASSF